MEKPRYKSTTHYVLSALIPYSKANLNLAFKPYKFFAELKKVDRQTRPKSTYRNAYYRLVKKGLIEMDDMNIPRLTPKGKQMIRRFEPTKLPKGAKLMIIFDIPEAVRSKRDRLRKILHELSFQQVQRSVWVTEYDHHHYIKQEIEFNNLQNYVQLFEANRIN